MRYLGLILITGCSYITGAWVSIHPENLSNPLAYDRTSSICQKDAELAFFELGGQTYMDCMYTHGYTLVDHDKYLWCMSSGFSQDTCIRTCSIHTIVAPCPTLVDCNPYIWVQ